MIAKIAPKENFEGHFVHNSSDHNISGSTQKLTTKDDAVEMIKE